MHLGDYEDAAKWLSQSVVVNPNFAIAHFFLAAALGQLGRTKEALAEAQAGLAPNVHDQPFPGRRGMRQPDLP